MPRTTGPQKLERLLRFLVGLREADLLFPLMHAGFADADLAEGWTLLRETSITKLAEVGPDVGGAARLAETELEEWARRYIKLIEPAILRRHEAQHAFLYGNLVLQGPHVILSVERFIERVRKLSKRSGGVAARALLEARGLTEDAMEAMRPVLLRAKSITPKKMPKSRDWARAEDAAWRWYLEWSKVARASIENGRVLHRLGLTHKEPTSG